MAINLNKGGRVSLSKESPGLTKILVGLGWDANTTDTGTDFDLDASVFMLNEFQRVQQDRDFVFYNNPQSTDGSVVHTGDNRTGSGDGDDEQIIIDLSKISPHIKSIAITVTIYDAIIRRQNFGMVRNAYIRVMDAYSEKEITRYDLEEDFSSQTALLFGTLYLKDGEWRFKADGTGYNGGLEEFTKKYGL